MSTEKKSYDFQPPVIGINPIDTTVIHEPKSTKLVVSEIPPQFLPLSASEEHELQTILRNIKNGYSTTPQIRQKLMELLKKRPPDTNAILKLPENHPFLTGRSK